MKPSEKKYWDGKSGIPGAYPGQLDLNEIELVEDPDASTSESATSRLTSIML